jgi:hypothetical protein
MRLRRSSSVHWLSGRPSRRIVPCSGRRNFSSREKMVVFPAPEGRDPDGHAESECEIEDVAEAEQKRQPETVP